MPRLVRVIFAAYAILGTVYMATAGFAQSVSKLHFEHGNDNTAVSGAVKGNDYADYVLVARAGQTMAVSLTVDGGNGDGTAYFNILPPGSQGEAIFIGSMQSENFGQIVLPRDGDYTVRVYLMGNDKDAGKTVRYTVSFTIR